MKKKPIKNPVSAKPTWDARSVRLLRHKAATSIEFTENTCTIIGMTPSSTM